MPLITTIEEFRAGVPVNVTSSIELLAGALAAAERRHIVPVLGRPQYDELSAAYLASSLTAPQAQLLAVVQAALANLAYVPYITIAQLDISDAGIRIQSDENHKTAFQWQIDDLRDLVSEAGFAALEDTLAFLDEHKAAFPKWAASDAYTYNKQLLLNSAADFNRHYSLAGARRTFLALLPVLRRVEHFGLEPVLSAEFCDALRAEIQTGTVAPATQAVLKLLHPALANLTVAEAVADLAVDLAAGGLVVRELDKNGSNNRVQKQASDTLLALKRNQALETGRAYLRDLVAFLNKTASATVYPSYFASARYAVPAPPPDPTAQPTPARVGGLYGAC